MRIKEYLKISLWIALGCLLMLIFSNTELRWTRLDQHATTIMGDGKSEDIDTHRSEVVLSPTEEAKGFNLFGDAPAKKDE